MQELKEEGTVGEFGGTGAYHANLNVKCKKGKTEFDN